MVYEASKAITLETEMENNVKKQVELLGLVRIPDRAPQHWVMVNF